MDKNSIMIKINPNYAVIYPELQKIKLTLESLQRLKRMTHVWTEMANLKNQHYIIQFEINATSGVHFSGMLSRESGESMLKHIKMTSVSG